MTKNILFLFFCIMSFAVSAQSPVGVWKNLDDEDGKEKSHIEIYQQNGKFRGKVVKLLPAATVTKCNSCKGDKKGKDLLGMDILWDMKETGKVWDGGQILDPKNGKEYNCKIECDGTEKLKVRGYVGVSIFGRTQVWYKVK